MAYKHEFDSFAIGKHQFKAYTEYDGSAGSPWDNDCIYEGVVSDWTQRDPEPHERIVCSDRNSRRIFDGWQYIKLAIEHGCTPKQAGEQLERSFQHVKDWCDDKWHYVGVTVELVDEDGDEIESDSLWSIESDDYTYIEETARELAQAIAERLNKEACKAWRGALKEARERRYWAARDVFTVSA